MQVILVEPWYGGSHRAWADGLARHSRHRISLVTHDAAFWRWRMRGGALTLAEQLAAVVARDGPPDVLIVSDMVELPALLGFARRFLPPETPVVLYLHENQLAHPPSGDGGADHLYATINWLSMAAADVVVCNSAFHRDALAAALPAFLASAPDQAHGATLPGVLERMTVLPVGIEAHALVDAPRASWFDQHGVPLIVWNQRWDHDREPEALFRVLRALARNGVPFQLALAGENIRSDPREFHDVQRDLPDRIAHAGWVPTAGYRALLGRADVVVSVANHEFFGIAVVEAMAAGAVPLLPRRLSYPELIPPALHDAVLYGSNLYDHLERVLSDFAAARDRVAGLRDHMRAFAWEAVARQYDELLDDVVTRGR